MCVCVCVCVLHIKACLKIDLEINGPKCVFLDTPFCFVFSFVFCPGLTFSGILYGSIGQGQNDGTSRVTSVCKVLPN